MPCNRFNIPKRFELRTIDLQISAFFTWYPRDSMEQLPWSKEQGAKSKDFPLSNWVRVLNLRIVLQFNND